MKNEMITKATGTINKIGFKLRKHSPAILMTAGVIGTVTGVVLACKATLKVNDILDETKEQLDRIHECAENPELAEEYSEEDAKKDTTILYVHTGLKFVRLYAPSAALCALSIASMVGSHVILQKRNVALAAAFATVNTSFKEYRQRVVDRFGEEIDRQLKYNYKSVEVEETVTDENGEEKTEKKVINVVDPNGYSDYARFFDESSPYWKKDEGYNAMFVKSIQNWANDKLKANGMLFLNEVYEALGIPPTKAGQIVGWVYDPDHPVGDNFVDFGMYDMSRPVVRDFVNGYERSILLDFNVDGNIWDLM